MTILNISDLMDVEFAGRSQLIQITWKPAGWEEQARVVQLQTHLKTLAVYHSAAFITQKGAV